MSDALSNAVSTLPPWPKRWIAYFKERFKIGTNLIATGLLVGAASLAAMHHSRQIPTKLMVGPMLLVSAVYFLIFLHLRVFDEHKDYAVDSVRFPERVLSKGWVTLAQLRRIAYVIIPAELILASMVGQRFLVAAAGLLIYSLLMLKEFFVADWLKRHMILYGVSHMAILFLMVIGVFAALGDYVLPGLDLTAQPLLFYALNVFCWVYSLEIARKIRAPEKEMPDVDTYSKLLGVKGAVAGVLLCQTAGLLMLAASRLPVSTFMWGTVIAATGTEVAGMLTALAKPTAEKLAKLDNVAALPFLTLQIALIVGWTR